MFKNYYIRCLNDAGFAVLPLKKLDAERQEKQKEKRELRRQYEMIHKKLESLQKEHDETIQEKETLIQKNADLIKDNLEQVLKDSEKLSVFFNNIIGGVLRQHHKSVSWGDRLLTLDKSAGFFEEDKFKECHRQLNKHQNYDQYAGPDGIAWRFNTLVWGAKCALSLPGDFVECGVFKGDMSWIIVNVIDWGNVDKTFYLYDTFEGFSPDYTSQEDFPFNPGFLDYANKIYRIPGLYEQVCERFREFSNVKVIKGVLPDILATESAKQIAFLHIDLNSAKPEIGVLEILFDRVVPGGIIIFDDYGWLEYIKQKKAEDSFMEKRCYSILELPTGQGLVVKR